MDRIHTLSELVLCSVESKTFLSKSVLDVEEVGDNFHDIFVVVYELAFEGLECRLLLRGQLQTISELLGPGKLVGGLLFVEV